MENNVKWFLSADSRIVYFKLYFKILHTFKKLIIKRDLPLMKLALFSLSNICLLFLEVKAIINDNFKKIFYSSLSSHSPKITHFTLKVQFHGTLFLKIKMSKLISSRNLLFLPPIPSPTVNKNKFLFVARE